MNNPLSVETPAAEATAMVRLVTTPVQRVENKVSVFGYQFDPKTATALAVAINRIATAIRYNP